MLLALLLGYALWTVYENTLTTAALDQGPSSNATPSPGNALSATAARALKAYGGEAVWRDATTVESTVTVGGLLFQLKGINIPPHAKITVDVQRPHTVIDPVDASGDTGVLDGFTVKILSPSGTILDQRADAREHLQNASISTKWDRLNLVYFLGYANLPVHSRIQRFWFDKKTGLLRRNDYTPVAASRDARAAHVIFEHGVSNGIPYPSKRRVKMSVGQYAWVLPFPDFITIDVERWQLR
ncbi:MAG: hypothetical protein E6J16_07425 [Chloroflexota bacterium]|nr:MAG: hypothetical protein E6J16_07425 [Chloroflexota bacterium]